MKPISLMKTMPWLISASAVFTLAFSQNVSAQDPSSQATSIKQVNKTNSSQANFNLETARMAYLNTSAKLLAGKTNWPLPKKNGLSVNYNQNNVNGYFQHYSYFRTVYYSLSTSSKPFEDTSVKSDTDTNHVFLGFSDEEWDSASDAASHVVYQNPSQLSGYNQTDDLGNGIPAYTRSFTRGRQAYIFYTGSWEISVTGATKADALDSAKKAQAKLSQQNLPKTDSHGLIELETSALAYANQKEGIGLDAFEQTTWNVGKSTFRLQSHIPAANPGGYNNPESYLTMLTSIR